MRWNIDLKAERDVRKLRTAAAIACGIGALWIIALGPTVVGWVVAVCSALACVGYLASARRSRRRAPQTEAGYMELDAEGMVVCTGSETTRLAWQEVLSTEIDEDKLVLVIQRRNAPPLSIPPVFEGLGLYEMGAAVERHRAQDREA